MLFSHSPQLLDQFPQLSVATLSVTEVTAAPDVADTTRPFLERATARLAERPESEFPEITAWRRAFSQMGLKPTQYRCASEALLRRFRKDGSLPSIHPLVDVCNAVSLAYAIPIAVFDLDQVTGNLTVRHATGTETYATFAGDSETPEAGEVIFADDAGHAHARRWTNRQSGRSAIRPETHVVLIVSEAMHDTGQHDLNALREELREALTLCWTVTT
jgi:DNA/RNA-binding domain of Phe-tRNA-synthetase-like protein